MIIGLRRTILFGTVGAVAAIIILLPFFIGFAFPLPSSSQSRFHRFRR